MPDEVIVIIINLFIQEARLIPLLYGTCYLCYRLLVHVITGIKYDTIINCRKLSYNWFVTTIYLYLLGVFYYTLGNIDPLYRSQLKCIQIVSIARRPIVKKYGTDVILQAFMNDLSLLEQVSKVMLI